MPTMRNIRTQQILNKLYSKQLNEGIHHAATNAKIR